jgi:hypothetical protein
MDTERKRIGISPPAEHQRRVRLWSALEAAYPVRFLPREGGASRDLDAAILIGGALEPPDAIPWLRMVGEEAQVEGPRAVLGLADSEALAPPLRSAGLTDRYAGTPAEGIGEGTVLAVLDGAPAWVARAGDGPPGHDVACAPAELGEREALRERLQAGRCLALLALAHFLGDLVGVRRDAVTHASFVIDDPNLHWPSYGHIRYDRLLADARECGYHVAIAMAPLDGWLAHPGAVRLFREGSANLSICIHGNDHDGPELSRHESFSENLALAAQALERSRSFERRTGIGVDRVMVPPHERISETAAVALRAAGFEAICTTRPYPWVATSSEVSWLSGPVQAGALSGWGPCELVAGGVPMLLRTDFVYPREDHVLRAFLGQPSILYGHHDLLADGLEVLGQAAQELNRLGRVRWSSLAEIARAVAPAQAAPREPEVVPNPTLSRRLRVRPILRRIASEGRDRVQAIV